MFHDRYRHLCDDQGGKLPEPRNEKENDFLDSLNTEMFVLGINDKVVEGTWVFDSDNSKVRWTKWARYDSIPNEGRDGNCAFMTRNYRSQELLHTKDAWSDYPCADTFYNNIPHQLVCERNGTQAFYYYYYYYYYSHGHLRYEIDRVG